MDYATNFAIIEDGVVINIIWGMLYNTQTDFPNSVQIDNLGVTVGDTYIGEKFYHNGEEVITIEERIAKLEAKIKEFEGV